MRVIFIRHGQTTGDVEARYGGEYDDHLTLEGERQSEALREELKDKKIAILISSPFIRARETADIISQGLIPITVEKGFKERNSYGILTGMNRNEAQEKFPILVERLKDRLDTIDGAESYEDFRMRIHEAFNRLSINSPHECVGVIWHGGPMRTLFRDVLKKGELGKDIGNCAWVELHEENGALTIKDSRRIEFLF